MNNDHVSLSLSLCTEWTSEDGDDIGDSLCVSDTAADILHLLTSLDGQQEVLTQLLQEKNLEGYTPFMAAVACKVACTHTHTQMVALALAHTHKHTHVCTHTGLQHSTDVIQLG